MLRRLSQTVIRDRRVLLRVDFNVPVAGGRVTDTFRIERTLPTVRRLLRDRNVVVILSHHSNPRQTLAPVSRRLARLLGKAVTFVRNPFTAAARRAMAAPGRGAFFVENLRFWRGEQGRSPAFARALARLGEVYVNDAFGVSHRSDASLTLLPAFLPAYLGLVFEAELRALDRVLERPRRPLVAIFGGVKLGTKLALLGRFARRADAVLVGGAIANALLRARGWRIRIPEDDRAFLAAARRTLARSRTVVLPVDVVARSRRSGSVRRLPVEILGADDEVLDLGPETVSAFSAAIRDARTVVWNGPLGIVELPRGRGATAAVARACGRSRTWSVVGGGDTVAALARARLLGNFRFVSTGGGAMIAYLAGEKLPGLEALRHARR